MNYKIYIDDERLPSTNWAKDGSVIIIVRNMEQFKEVIAKFDKPVSISFDHDLGENQPTGYDIAHWLVYDCQLDTRNIDINVHSANPVGANNIRMLFNSWERFLNENFPRIFL